MSVTRMAPRGEAGQTAEAVLELLDGIWRHVQSSQQRRNHVEWLQQKAIESFALALGRAAGALGGRLQREHEDQLEKAGSMLGCKAKAKPVVVQKALVRSSTPMQGETGPRT